MPTFIMLTRLNPDAVRSPRGLEQLGRDAMNRVRQECPDVEWLSSYARAAPAPVLAGMVERLRRFQGHWRRNPRASCQIHPGSDFRPCPD